MDPGQAKTDSPAVGGDLDAGKAVDLDAIIDLIRAGDASGLKELHGILSPGVRLLIGLRLGRRAAAKEAKAVLETAAQRIQADGSLRAREVISLVRRLIAERRRGDRRGQTEGLSSRAARRMEVAAKVVEQLSPLEREALRRCYVLGEKPEEILQRLDLSREQFRDLRSSARAEFSSKVFQKTHVA